MAVRMILAILLLAAGWQEKPPAAQKGADSKTPYVEKSEQQFAFYPGGKLEISASAPGSFIIAGWDKAEIRVELEKIFYYLTPEEAKALVKRFPVRVTRTQTSAKVITSGGKKPGVSLEVNARVFVPRQRTDLNIKMVKGDLAVAGLNGWVEATIEEGNLDAHDLAGYFSAKTRRGDLTVALSGSRWLGFGFTAATEHGSADLILPPDYSAALQLETKNGNITIDYPAQTVEGESVPLEALAKKKVRTLTSPIGTGGVSIKVITLLGDIALKAGPKGPQIP